ncbi:hypothetical protein D3C72_1202410 [compost metagenome]
MTVALPADRQILYVGQRRRLQRLHQLSGRHAIGQRQLAPGENQHVAHLVLQLVQALLEAPGKALLGSDRQLLLGQMTGIQQRGGQRRAYLMSQRSDHAPQRRQPLMTGQLILQVTGFSQVVEQHQLARLGVQRARGDRQAPTILEGDFMTIVFARRKTAGNDVAPQFTFQRQPQQLARRRIGFAHDALGVNDDDAAG